MRVETTSQMATKTWSVGSALKSHTMAADIINRDKVGTSITDINDQRILDASNLALLQRFCAAPSTKDEILRDEDMLDSPGDKVGSKALSKGHLVGYMIARHDTENPALEDREIEMLREWFERGEADMETR